MRWLRERVTAREWQFVDFFDHARRLTINVSSGDPKCELIDRVETRETMTDVTLTVLIREVADAGRCRGGVIRQMTIPLAQPLRGRVLIDGATGIEVPWRASPRAGTLPEGRREATVIAPLVAQRLPAAETQAG
jgi:hypothetical protein